MAPRFRLAIALGLILSAVASLAAPAAAQQRLDPGLARRVDSVFGRFTAPGSPGCALGVVRDGRLDYARGYGLASIELGVAITPATVFDIVSVSKQFTAMAFVLLAQDGKLALDDEIQKFLPEIPRFAKPIRIRHLLHHTSGLRDYIDLLGASGVQEEMVTGDREALEILARQRGTNFEPGAEFLYSNTGFFLLSVIVQRASGHSLREFAAERIFRPLGMLHTQFVDRHDLIVPGKAGSYAMGGGGFRLALANWEQTGDGAVNTTVEDLLLWDRNFYDPRVGGAAALRELQTPGVLNDGKPITYALGLVVDSYRGVRAVTHGGSWAGFRAQLSRYPDQKTSVMVLCNLAQSAPGMLAGRVADILLGGQLSAPPGRPPAALAAAPVTWDHSALASLAGTYRSDELLADWKISVEHDTAYVRVGPTAPEVMAPLASDSLRVAGFQVGVVRLNDRISGITLTSRGVRGLFLTRIDDAR
jgi:CubicO group peptidase (beta-lactamase class C family)